MQEKKNPNLKTLRWVSLSLGKGIPQHLPVSLSLKHREKSHSHNLLLLLPGVITLPLAFIRFPSSFPKSHKGSL